MNARAAFLSFAAREDGGAGGYERSIFEELATLEPLSFWFRSRNRLLAWALETYFPDARTLRELRYGVYDGSGPIVTVPRHRRVWSADDFGHHQRRYTRAALLAKLRRAGFDPLRVMSFISLLSPVMMAMCKVGARSSESFNFRSEVRNPPLLDRALKHVVSLERALIRSGASRPAAGSLLVVSRAVLR